MDGPRPNAAMSPPRDRDLGLYEDPRFFQREWRAQRVGWGVLAVLVVAALLGVFGRGPLAHAGAGEGPLSMKFDRFLRHGAPSDLEIEVAAGSADAEGRVRLWFDRRYLEKVRVEKVIPEPEWMEAAAERVTYVFRASSPKDPIHVVLELNPDRIGLQRGRAAVMGGAGGAGGAPLDFEQLVFP